MKIAQQNAATVIIKEFVSCSLDNAINMDVLMATDIHCVTVKQVLLKGYGFILSPVKHLQMHDISTFRCFLCCQSQLGY